MPCLRKPIRSHTSDARGYCTAFYGNKFIIPFTAIFYEFVRVITLPTLIFSTFLSAFSSSSCSFIFVSFILVLTRGSSATGQFPRSPDLRILRLRQGFTIAHSAPERLLPFSGNASGEAHGAFCAPGVHVLARTFPMPPDAVGLCRNSHVRPSEV